MLPGCKAGTKKYVKWKEVLDEIIKEFSPMEKSN
jgi:hypothetical protein